MVLGMILSFVSVAGCGRTAPLMFVVLRVLDYYTSIRFGAGLKALVAIHSRVWIRLFFVSLVLASSKNLLHFRCLYCAVPLFSMCLLYSLIISCEYLALDLDVWTGL